MIDKRPRLIARCVDVAGVMACVNFARENDLLLAVKGGGHNVGGLATCNDGLVIDLSLMRGRRVDPAARTVRVEGGCTWGDVDHATHPFGLAVPCGFISTTGVGGIGYLTRSCGLTIDNLLSADLVLADGSFLTVSDTENSDLFWAIRGGGGNFGVVTSFVFRLHPVDMIHGGPMLWEMEQAQEVLRWYRSYIMQAPEDNSCFFAFLTVPPEAPFPEHLHNRKMCGLVWCYTGPAESKEEAFRPVRDLPQAAFEFVVPLPFPVLNSLFDHIYPPGLQMYWKSDYFKDLPDEAIRLHAEHGAKMPTDLCTMHIYPMNGAAHRVGHEEMAFSSRDSNWAEVIVGVDRESGGRERITGWARDYWQALHPFSSGGAYVNLIMEEGQEGIEANYRGNYSRLVEIKTRYDADNLFRVNQNIKPQGR